MFWLPKHFRANLLYNAGTMKKAPIGRPSSFTPELAMVICSRVAAGSNLSRISAEDGMPARETVYQWLRAHPAFADDYARAREDRADHRFDKIDDVIQDMRIGTIDSNQARVEIDVIKWQAGKEKPKTYGDKIQTEHSGSISMGIAETLRARRAKRIDDVNPAP